ncbi:MAG: hypothetical protein E6Q97_11280 [Desulfurellales bacterium]|nr:MAG: hypothetical protein E6Q97_11280 [Desulfurellales bacterium]
MAEPYIDEHNRIIASNGEHIGYYYKIELTPEEQARWLAFAKSLELPSDASFQPIPTEAVTYKGRAAALIRACPSCG